MPLETAQLTPRELARYSRHIVLQEVGRKGQERLRSSKVLVVGAGGLGSPASLYLAAAGIGTIGVADFDRVEEHNLQRQILHGTTDVGNFKADSAEKQIHRLNPHVEIRLHEQGVSADNSVGLFSEYDVVVDGSDNFSTRYLNNDSAFFAGKPLVYGSIFKFEGQASFFNPRAGTPCYRCLFPEPPRPGAVPNCGEAGVFGALPGVIGSIQAMEAIKYLIGIGELLAGRLLVFDALRMNFRSLNLRKDPGCPLCGEQAEIDSVRSENYDFSCSAGKNAEENSSGNRDKADPWPLEISVHKARSLLKADRSKVFLLDIREPYETEICRIEGSETIPMNEISEKLGSIPRDRHVLVFCHYGGRSLQTTKYLRNKGFPSVSNVAGGIDAWADEFDPSMPRY